MHLEECQYRLRDVAEQEPGVDHHRQLDNRYRQVLHIDKWIHEYLDTHIREVKHLGGPVDTQHHRVYTHDGYHGLLNQIVSPRLGDRLLHEALTLGVNLQIATQTVDGEYTRELHDPPDDELYGKQRVAQERAYYRCYKHGERYVGVEDVASWYVLVVAAYHYPLPDGANQEYRG